MGAMLLAMLRRDWITQWSYRGAFFGRTIACASSVFSSWFLANCFSGYEPEPIATYGNYFNFLIFGLLLMQWTQSILFGATGRIRALQVEGSLESWAAYCPSLGRLIWAEALSVQLASIWPMMLTLGLGFALGLSIDSSGVALKLGSVLLCWAALCPLGIWGGAFTLAFKRSDPLGRAVLGLSWLLSGVFYPVEVLPKWLTLLAYFLPTTHALDLLRGVFLRGDDWAALSGSVWALVLLSAIGWPLALGTVRICDRIARRYGTLGQY